MPKDIYAILAGQLRTQRKRAGLSIEKLAEIAGIGPGFLAHIETNQKKPSVATLGRIANALQIPVARLFDQHPGPVVDEDMRLALQFAQLLRKKTPAQKKAIIGAVRSLAKTV